MPKFNQLPRAIFRLIKRPPQIAYSLGLGPLIGRLVLLLTTNGRISGLPRITPLQYETTGDVLYVGAARGMKADWVRNILAHPRVEVRVKNQRFKGTAEVITSPDRIVDFLELRIENHPHMMATMLKADGVSPHPTRSQLAGYAAQIVLVAITPDKINEIDQRGANG